MDKPWKYFAKQKKLGIKEKKLGIENCMFYIFMDLKALKESDSQEVEVHYEFLWVLK